VAPKNLARRPNSTVALATAAARWVFPTPEGPKMRQFSARSNQEQSVANCIRGAGLNWGRWDQSKLERVLAWGSCASGFMGQRNKKQR